jgi:23S rRNA pseudouridine1911/1915/1917 synthase
LDEQISEVITLVVPKEAAGTRFDRFLAERLRQFSRSRIQQFIRSGAATLKGKQARPRDFVRAGDDVRLLEPPLEKIDHQPEEIPLDVLFEDDDLIVLNKPAGLVIHPGAGHQKHTLVNALLSHCHNLSGIGGKERPGIVHRLDKDTSGCVVVAKNDATHHGLSAQFAERTVEKIYLALVNGKLRRNTGSIDADIARHPVQRKKMTASSVRGRSAKTEYRVLRDGPTASLIECRLHSGRTHQIRVHFHHIGHPILGDKIYGPKAGKIFPRQMLHAWKLGFKHPRTGDVLRFEASIPADFTSALRQLGM